LDFAACTERAFLEWERRRTIFDLPAAAFYRPRAGIGLATTAYGQRAANPLGPASGPHTQLAPSIVRAWLSGARVFELKTVHPVERTSTPQRSIDVGSLALHIESAHELPIDVALAQFVGGSMLIEMLEESGVLEPSPGERTIGAGDLVFDLSASADRHSLENSRFVGFVRGCQDTRGVVEELRKA